MGKNNNTVIEVLLYDVGSHFKLYITNGALEER